MVTTGRGRSATPAESATGVRSSRVMSASPGSAPAPGGLSAAARAAWLGPEETT